jgi:YidC/Oxa1 family membrane protein insertase
MNPFAFLANPFQWILEELTKLFSSVGPIASIGAFGVAVIVLTIAIRAVLFPVFGWQLRTSRRIQSEQRRVAPQLQELRKKYKGQPQKLSAEMNKVYREHGISPFSGLTGCIPALVQMPVLIGLYYSISNATKHLNPMDKGFLWISDVSQSAQHTCCADGNWSHLLLHPAVLILPLVAGLLTFAQTRMMSQPPRADMSDQERSMMAVTKQMSFIFPVIIFVIGLLFPQGLAIYWVTGSLFMVAQQFYVVGWGGLKVPHWWPGANRVTPLSFPKAEPSGALVSVNGSKNVARPRAGASREAAATATARTDQEEAPRPAPRPVVRTGARPSQRARRRRRR